MGTKYWSWRSNSNTEYFGKKWSGVQTILSNLFINVFIYLFILFGIFSNVATGQVSRNFNKSIKPLYELGAGFAYFSVANYPGAKNNTLRFFPFPIAIYRGAFVRADEDGTRARLIHSDFIELGFSGGFNFAIRAQDNEVREGMPDTEALLGIGPGVIFKFLKTNRQKLNIGIGLRTNLEIGRFPVVFERGLIIEPYLRYWYKPLAQGAATFFSGLSVSAADQKYNEFFYSVEQKYETSERNFYRSTAGLVDIAASLGVTYDFKSKVSIFVGLVYSNLTLAANKTSPLVENQHNYAAVLGLTWLFSESKYMVQ